MWVGYCRCSREKQKRGEENREKEKKKRQQSSLRSFFDFQLVHRWIELIF
jgi:DNA invertase Pin-like site-specific DNA recombinase